MKLIETLRQSLTRANNEKPINKKFPLNNLLENELEAKVFYLHKVPDYKDADNISKPLWDCLNKVAYNDDKQIKYIETLKINTEMSDILEIEISNLDDYDCELVLDFLLNNNSNTKRLIYVALSKFDIKKIRLI